ncbi:MAG: hypothetical protein NTX33_17510 [Propionibacteriales bacterium]|nr:hypothetical protein [Propionibacteriales bacterium]
MSRISRSAVVSLALVPALLVQGCGDDDPSAPEAARVETTAAAEPTTDPSVDGGAETPDAAGRKDFFGCEAFAGLDPTPLFEVVVQGTLQTNEDVASCEWFMYSSSDHLDSSPTSLLLSGAGQDQPTSWAEATEFGAYEDTENERYAELPASGEWVWGLAEGQSGDGVLAGTSIPTRSAEVTMWTADGLFCKWSTGAEVGKSTAADALGRAQAKAAAVIEFCDRALAALS